jgi:hypothetical protein
MQSDVQLLMATMLWLDKTTGAMHGHTHTHTHTVTHTHTHTHTHSEQSQQMACSGAKIKHCVMLLASTECKKDHTTDINKNASR